MKRNLGGTILAALVVTLAFASEALAAQWNSLQDSSVVSVFLQVQGSRHITTPNDKIQVQLNSFPSGGVRWRAVNLTTLQLIGAEVNITNASAFTLVTNLSGNPTFGNFVRSNTTNGSHSGMEWY